VQLYTAILIKVHHPSKAEKSNTSAKGLLGIAKKLISDSQQAFRARIRLFRFARGRTTLIEIAVYT
jgi:hypothetical protein